VYLLHLSGRMGKQQARKDKTQVEKRVIKHGLVVIPKESRQPPKGSCRLNELTL
jgi:hypothetical protein